MIKSLKSLKSQKGIGFIALLLIIAIIVGLITAGVYIYHHSAKPNYGKMYSSCGTVELTSENGEQFFLSDNDYNKLRNCFVDNYNVHTSTSISLHMRGVDTQSINTFTYNEKNIINRSSLTGAIGNHGSISQTCSKVIEKPIGILFSCDNGDILYSRNSSHDVSNNSF